MEKSYFEIKITFTHIVVMLVSVVFIGILLFYLGYRAGRSAYVRPAASGVENSGAPAQQTIAVDEKPVKAEGSVTPRGSEAISQELKLHRQVPAGEATTPAVPADTTPPPAPAAKPASGQSNPAPAAGGPVYTIQIGAFSDSASAKKEAEKYTALNYAIEIIPEFVKGKSYFTVRVGRYTDHEEAVREKGKLEKMSGKKFMLKKSK